jgi:tryptophan halogenase
MHDRTKEIEDVLVVGGGDVGLLTGLCIERANPDLDIAIVDDFEADPPEVGKSTYEEITGILHDFLEIQSKRFVTEVKPIWKGSVYFRDWCGYDPFHYAFDEGRKLPNPDTPRFGEYCYHYYHDTRTDPDRRTVNEVMVEEGKSAMSFDSTGGPSFYDTHAYHLDLSRFNAFLERVCGERGLDLVNDEITTVETSDDHIQRVSSSGATYEADLYVDATGFNRVLKHELNDDFRDFDLPLDAEYNTKLERPLSEAVPGTVIETGPHGWFWQIDTYEFRDVGYVFASDFVGDEEAKTTFVDHCGDKISTDDLIKHEFTSGYYATPLQGNCLTIGNAEGFVEPLQSTGLTANTRAAIEFAHLLSAHGGTIDGGIRETYNAWVRRLWDSIYDFISVHYRFADGDTAFWKAMQSVPLSDRVQKIVQSYDRRGFDSGIDPVENDDALSDLLLFPPQSFYTIMSQMGVESALYEGYSIEVSDDVRSEMDALYASMDAEADQLLTIEEVYKGVLPQVSGTR